ncbi:MAG: hypothetical protein GC155_05230 [Alphaproteobacteria bacterium]|nr:hypothetical protein [Alphaproteobacteria bacterium]
MTFRSIFVPVVLILAGCASAPSENADVHAFMVGYTQAWNAHDAAKIARDYYRMGPGVEDQQASLTRSFEGLVAQGYDKSDIHEIKTCITGPDTAWAGMHFTRLKANGEPLPPKDRASQYNLKKFADGWRITKLMGGDASKPLACPAAGAAS